MTVWSSSYDHLRSLGRSVARSLGRSVARSVGRSLARSLRYRILCPSGRRGSFVTCFCITRFAILSRTTIPNHRESLVNSVEEQRSLQNHPALVQGKPKYSRTLILPELWMRPLKIEFRRGQKFFLQLGPRGQNF